MFRTLRGIPLLGCLLSSIGCHGQPPAPPPIQKGDYGAIIRYLQTRIPQDMARENVAGLSIALLNGQELI
ncbi:MAG: serine hydrolase, partial [Pseudomonas sp.]